MMKLLHKLISAVRRISGDDAYERYLAHWRARHSTECTPLDPKAFFKAEQERKWNGVRRCC
jgi:uncharacterized short protein YbdD (DUF466 family)